MVLTVVLLCISLMTIDVKHLFMCLLVISISSLEISPLLIFKLGCLPFVVELYLPIILSQNVLTLAFQTNDKVAK